MYSFIIPVFNVNKDFLIKCLDSLEIQTETHEILVIDDGSDFENSKEYNRIVNQYNSATIFHLTNHGVSYARNFGISKANGEWIIFVDSDDWIEERTLNTIDNNINDNVDIVMFDAYINRGGGVQYINKFWDEGEKIFEDEDKRYLQMQMISKRSLPYANPKYNTSGVVWGKCYRTSFLRKYKLEFKEGITVNEDILFNLYAIESARSLKYIGIPLYHYRKNNSSVMNTFKANDWDNNLKVINEIKNFLQLSGNFKKTGLNIAFEYKIMDISLYLCK